MRCLLHLEHMWSAQHGPPEPDPGPSFPFRSVLLPGRVDINPHNLLELPPNRSSLKSLVFLCLFCVCIQLLSSADRNPSEAPLCACLC